MNSDGITSVKDYKNVNLDGVESLEQLNIAPEFKHLDKSKPHGIDPKPKGCHGKKFKGPKVEPDENGVVVGPFKSYEEVQEFTKSLVHNEKIEYSSANSWISGNDSVQSTKNWANDLVKDVKDIDFKQSFKNIATDNDALIAVSAGVLSGVFLYCIIYLVYLRKLAFDSQFEDYEAAPVSLPEYSDEKLPLYEDEDSSDHE